MPGPSLLTSSPTVSKRPSTVRENQPYIGKGFFFGRRISTRRESTGKGKCLRLEETIGINIKNLQNYNIFDNSS